jgi:hypothetical protein
MEAFAERARRELRATGETLRTRTVPAARAAGAGAVLTPQEAQVARLPGRACLIRGSAPGCSSARAPPSTTSATTSPSSASPPAASSTACCPSAGVPPARASASATLVQASPRRAKPWPVALCTGGSGRGLA